MDITTAVSAITSTMLAATVAEFDSHWFWALVLAFHLSFLFAFAMGANEVSNAFATSVGSGVLSLRVAYVLATIFESVGGILLGYQVLKTLRFGIIDLRMYEGEQEEFLLGQVAILAASGLWMFGATILRYPCSSTHSHIGSIVGFSLFMKGFQGLQMGHVYKILASWVISPIFSGVVSAILYILMDFLILRRRDPLKCAYRVLPIVYFLVFTFISFVVLYRGTKWLHFDQIGGWLALVIALGIGVAAGLVFQFVAKPYLVKWVDKHDASTVNLTVNGAEPTGKPPEMQRSSVGVENGATTYRPQRFHLSPTGFVQWFLPDRKRKDDPKTLRLFSAIQIFSACFTGFSHGSKDIPNTIAPLANFVFVFNTVRIPKPVETPLWFLIYGSFATCVGFWLMGHKVIKRVGTEFTEINPYCGFVVELGAAITVVIASKLGIPVSLSLCIVGSIVTVGAVRGSIPVNWSLFGKVFIGWVITFPLSGVFAAVFMAILKSIFIS